MCGAIFAKQINLKIDVSATIRIASSCNVALYNQVGGGPQVPWNGSEKSISRARWTTDSTNGVLGEICSSLVKGNDHMGDGLARDDAAATDAAATDGSLRLDSSRSA